MAKMSKRYGEKLFKDSSVKKPKLRLKEKENLKKLEKKHKLKT